jgi:hypothetical protein
MKRYGRRDVVVHALAVCGASLVAPAVLLGRTSWRQSSPDAGQAARLAAEYFGGRTETAQKVGAAFLRTLGAGDGHDAVLAATRSTVSLIERAGPAGALAAVEAAIERDYRSGRSLQVEGWLLARTELDLCALSMLSDVGRLY